MAEKKSKKSILSKNILKLIERCFINLKICICYKKNKIFT